LKKELDLNKDNFHKSTRDKHGFRNICIACRKGEHGKYYKKLVEKIRSSDFEKAKYILKIYGKLDRKHKRKFELTLDWILANIANKVCYYCGFSSNGIDRIDNSLGHSVKNSVPCCTECNNARMDNFSHEEFIIIGKTIREVKLKRNDS